MTHKDYDYNSYSGDVTIPATVAARSKTEGTKRYTVVGIGMDAFKGSKELTSVTIKEGVKSIGDDAFQGCDALKSVTIPNSVESIGKNAFVYCENLASVTLGEGLTHIAQNAFGQCSALTSITIPKGVTSIEDYTFERCTKLANVTLPSGLVNIGECAFQACDFKYITLPKTLKTIGTEAFEFCDKLHDVTIPDEVTSIGESAFSNCTGLVWASIGPGVTNIGEYAFWRCDAAESFTIRGEVPPTFGEKAFDSDKAGIFSKRTLYVPAQLLNTYKESSKWSPYFGKITNIPFDVYVNNQEITLQNYQDLYGNGNKEVTFDYVTNTLTLNNIRIATDGGWQDAIVSYGNGPTLNIRVVGDCLIENTEGSSYGIRSDYRGVNIYGDGKLTIANSDGGSCGICIENDLTIADGVTVEIISTNSRGMGLSLTSWGELTIDNATLIAQGNPSVAGIKSLVLKGDVQILSSGHVYDADKKAIVDASGEATSEQVTIGMVPTAIENVSTVENSQSGKFIKNGQLYIRMGGVNYNLQGVIKK
ncbi:MAG: leucine-rich repeat domain-containing protein [Bacteroidaceae bacterium]|nr:leucine-rich repeat domain-containing protein [Bacteroidaceae bacterium]